MITGLHTCKPKNAPQVGQVKSFVVIDMETYIKIKNPGKDDVGMNFKITKADKTDYSDRHGNISFNLEMEPTDEQPARTVPAPQITNANSPRTSQMNKDDYWERKEDRDRERDARDVAKQPRIERQHAQEMALRLATLDNRTVMDDKGVFSTKKLCDLISWFQRDVSRSPEKSEAEKTEPF